MGSMGPRAEGAGLRTGGRKGRREGPRSPDQLPLPSMSPCSLPGNPLPSLKFLLKEGYVLVRNQSRLRNREQRKRQR